MKKRGLEMQAHWIFILIAGAIILAFFFSIVAKQKSLSEQKISITLSANIEAVFSGAIESKGTAQLLTVPKDGIDFDCSEACDCNFWIGDKSTSFRDKIIFAPKKVIGQDATAWSSEWKLPFRVSNFLYITNPNVKYYIVYVPNTNSARIFDRINKTLPPGLNIAVLKDPGAVPSIPYEGFQETKFVFLDVPDSSINLAGLDTAFRKKDVSAVNIHQNTITFYEKEPGELYFTSGTSPFVGEALMFASIFSADKQMYDCGLQAAFLKLNHVAQIIYGRAKMIQQNLSLSKPECVYVLGDFNALMQLSGEFSSGIEFSQKIPGITAAANAIARENKNLILLSCPEIY
ncbi:hypothetical protein KY338_01045 [Candidatus Woesearchaeota archaeon]|nr:hypothetical protein [Candidatus Woesearchaeota archaeon]MBW3006184.1 hypothetical protein [Candidatus Woesearchaeota archaeon]